MLQTQSLLSRSLQELKHTRVNNKNLGSFSDDLIFELISIFPFLFAAAVDKINTRREALQTFTA
jgi:hypothetical protein